MARILKTSGISLIIAIPFFMILRIGIELTMNIRICTVLQQQLHHIIIVIQQRIIKVGHTPFTDVVQVDSFLNQFSYGARLIIINSSSHLQLQPIRKIHFRLGSRMLISIEYQITTT